MNNNTGINNTHGGAKISTYQLAALMLMMRLFAECMNFPYDTATYEMQRFTAVIVAKIILFLFFIPVLIFVKKHPGESFFTIMAGKSKILGWVIFVLATVHFTTDALRNIIKFEFFASNTIMAEASSLLLIILSTVVILYGVHKGLQASARLGGILLASFIILVIIGSSALFLTNSVNFNYLYPALIEDTDSFFNNIFLELQKNGEIFMFAILCRYVSNDKTKKSNAHRTLYIYLPMLLLFILFMTFLYIITFGPYIDIISFPYYTLTSLADVQIFDRLDGFDVVIWTVAAFLRLITVFICIRSMLAALIKEIPSKVVTSCILLVTEAVGYIFVTNRDNAMFLYNGVEFFVSLLVLGIIAPLTALFIGRGNKKSVRSN